MTTPKSQVNADDLVLFRDIRGNGGWSLHHPDTGARLLSGEEAQYTGGPWGHWSRPNADDYRAALAIATKAQRG